MLISLALDHRHADLEVREAFHLTEERLRSRYVDGTETGIDGIVALSTCNRTEVYAWSPVDAGAERAFDRLALWWTGRSSEATRLRQHAVARSGLSVAHHLLRVASGVESQVLGDGQLLSQLRAAYQRAADSGQATSVLRRLVETALHVGRRVRSETSLSNGKYSIGAEAASLAARRFGSLRHARVLVVGAGKTGARVARQLNTLGARDLVLLNRTEARAATLAGQLNARVAPLESLHAEAAMADIVILATDAPQPLLRSDPLVRARRAFTSAGHALLVIDLSMPRNVETSIRSIAGVVLVDLDTLRPAVTEGERERVAAIPAAEAIVDVELQRFADWMAAAEVRDAIRPFCDLLGAVCRQEVAFVSGDATVAERTASRIVAKLLAHPMVELRAALAREERVDAITDALQRLFGSAAPPPVRRTRAIA